VAAQTARVKAEGQAAAARSAAAKRTAARTTAARTAAAKAAAEKAEAAKVEAAAEEAKESAAKVAAVKQTAPRAARAPRTSTKFATTAKRTAAAAAGSGTPGDVVDPDAQSSTPKRTPVKRATTAKSAAAKTTAAKTARTTAAKTTAAKTTAAKSTAAKKTAAKTTAAERTPRAKAESAARTAPALIDAQAAAAVVEVVNPPLDPAAVAESAEENRASSPQGAATGHDAPVDSELGATAPAAASAPADAAMTDAVLDATVAPAAVAAATIEVGSATSTAEADPVGTEPAEAGSTATATAPAETTAPADEPAPAEEPEAPASAAAVPEEPVQESAETSQVTVEGSTGQALVVRGLVKRFGDAVAVGGIDLTVPAGSFYGIVGPNGAGKTTTLSIIAGLLRADEGTVLISGIDQIADPAAAKRALGVLPDRLRTFDRLTGRQLLHYYGLLRGLPADVVEKRVADLARAFDLTGALSRVVSDYSAGMTKKIMLAGAMIHSPRVLVLDEPFESVDPVSSGVILDILRAYVAHGGTVILSSHGMDLVEQVCARIAIIVGGEVLAEGTVDEVRAGQTLEQRFVELSGAASEVEGLEWLHTFSD